MVIERQTPLPLPVLPLTDSPHALGRLALALPFLRFTDLLRAAAMTLICWLGGILLFAVAMSLGARASENISTLLLVGQFLLVAGIVGLRPFNLNWSRVAFAWPDRDAPIQLWVRRPLSFRLVAAFGDPTGLVLRVVIGVPTFMLLAVVIAVSFVIHPALGVVAMYLLPVLPIALMLAQAWPLRTSLAVDAVPLRAGEARALAKGSLRFRVAAFAWVAAASWWLLATAFFVPFALESIWSLYPAFSLLGLAPCLILVTAWFNGAGALLYARLKASATAAVFE